MTVYLPDTRPEQDGAKTYLGVTRLYTNGFSGYVRISIDATGPWGIDHLAIDVDAQLLIDAVNGQYPQPRRMVEAHLPEETP